MLCAAVETIAVCCVQSKLAAAAAQLGYTDFNITGEVNNITLALDNIAPPPPHSIVALHTTGLSKGVIAGIIVGGIFVALVLAVIAFFAMWLGRRQRQARSTSDT